MKWKPLYITACGAAIAVGSLAAWAQVPDETKPTSEAAPVAQTVEQTDAKPVTAESKDNASTAKATEGKKAEQSTSDTKPATTISIATPKSSGTATATQQGISVTKPAQVNGTPPQPRSTGSTYGNRATTMPSAGAPYGATSSNFSVPRPAQVPGSSAAVPSTGSANGSSATTIPGTAARYGTSSNFSVPQQGTSVRATSEPQQAFIPGLTGQGTLNSVTFRNIEVKDSEITKVLQACSNAYLINEDTGRTDALSLYDLDDEALVRLGRVIQRSIENDPQPPKRRIEEMSATNLSGKHLHLHFSQRGHEEYGQHLPAVIERLRTQSQARQGKIANDRVQEMLGIAAGEATPSDPAAPSTSTSESRTAVPTSDPKPSTTLLVPIPGKKSSNGNRLATYFGGEVELKEVEATNASIVKTLKQLEDVMVMQENQHLYQFSIAGFDDQAREQLGQAIFRAIEKAPNPQAIPLEIMIFEEDKNQYLCIHFSPEGAKEYANLLLALRERLANEVHERRDQIVDVKINQLLNASDSITTDSPDAVGPAADDLPASEDRPDLPATGTSVHSSQNERQDVVDGKNHANQEFVIKDIGGKDTESKLQAIARLVKGCASVQLVVDNKVVEEIPTPQLDDAAVNQLSQVIWRAMKYDHIDPNTSVSVRHRSREKTLRITFSGAEYAQFEQDLRPIIERAKTQSQSPPDEKGAGGSRFAAPPQSRSTRRATGTFSDEPFELKPVEANVKAIAEALERFPRVELVIDGDFGGSTPITDFSAAERQQLGEIIMRAIEKDPHPPATPVEVRMSEKTNALRVHFSREGYDQYGKYLSDLIARLQLVVNLRKQNLAETRIGELLGQATSPGIDRMAFDSTGQPALVEATAGDTPVEVERNPRLERNSQAWGVSGRRYGGPTGGSGYVRGNSSQNIGVGEMTIAGALVGKEHLVIVSPQQQWVSIRMQDLDDLGRQQLARVIVKAIQEDKLPDVDRVVAYPSTENNEGSLDLFVSDKVFEEYRTLLPRVVSKLHQDFLNRMKDAEKKKLDELLKAAQQPVAGMSSGYRNDLLVPGRKIEPNVTALTEALMKAQVIVLVVDRDKWQYKQLVDGDDVMGTAARQRLAQTLLGVIKKDPGVEGNRLEINRWQTQPDGAVHVFFSQQGFNQDGRFLLSLIDYLREDVSSQAYSDALRRSEELLGPAERATAGDPLPQDLSEKKTPAPDFSRSLRNPSQPLWDANGIGYRSNDSAQAVSLDEKSIAQSLAGSDYLVVVCDGDVWSMTPVGGLNDAGKKQVANAIREAIRDDPLDGKGEVIRLVKFPVTKEKLGSVHLCLSKHGYKEHGKRILDMVRSLTSSDQTRHVPQWAPSIGSGSNTPLNMVSPPYVAQPVYQQPPVGQPGTNNANQIWPLGPNLPYQGNAASKPRYQPLIGGYYPDQKYQQLEKQAAELARRVKQAVGKPEEEDRLADELREVVKQAFELRMEKQRQQLDQAEAKLKASREHLQKRQQHAEQIITRRVEDLTGANPFPWEEGTQSGPSYFTPPTGNGGYNTNGGYSNGGYNNNYSTMQAAPAQYVSPPLNKQVPDFHMGLQGEPPQVQVPTAPTGVYSTSQWGPMQLQTTTAPTSPMEPVVPFPSSAPPGVQWQPEVKPEPSPKGVNAPSFTQPPSSRKKKPTTAKPTSPPPMKNQPVPSY